MSQHQLLRGQRVLICDDEYMIALMLEDTLISVGAMTSIATTANEAIASINAEPPTAAILDCRMGSSVSHPVADVLASHNVPFIFYSGGPISIGVAARYPCALALLKPAKLQEVLDVLAEACLLHAASIESAVPSMST